MPESICQHCEIVMVTGLRNGCNAADVKDNAIKDCEELISRIMGIGMRTARQHVLDPVINESRWYSPFKTEKQNVRQVQNIFDAPLKCLCHGKISRIILCHCHGSAIVYKALDKTRLLCTFRYDDELYGSKRSRLAIVSIGGAQIIPKDFAQVSLNIVFDSDEVVPWARRRWNSKPKFPCKESIIKYSVTEDEVSAQSTRSWLSSSSADTSASHKASTYVKNNEVIEEILRSMRMTAM